MKSNQDENPLIKSKILLDNAADDLDENTLKQLRLARENALKSHIAPSPKINWLIPTGSFAGLAVLAVTVSLLFSSPEHQELSGALTDIELLSSTESLEFFDELEFYAWLDEKEVNG